ncbi:ATP synthase subunit s, mitochondrial [Acyrthosiphon pisum]|uniref:Mitochondrial ATP synthase regulatory component factor B n=1 Tax=Acyrthosiphon pisum TaxID=7029 RepID=A0A8R2B8X0_ACYPI|nr:ATP synthase subunit s, mitochondrial [Acyrthosiphon pisum]|eukprot:XP_008186984.1 PREDICTED: ATP synthase subunit s, mitochondrial isoform X2 [Acyrthosiphon pisum]
MKMLKTLQYNFLKINTIGTNKRCLWQWVDDTFNSLDEDRIKEIGPNLACAEWLMKNGAQVRWKGCKEFVSHYNCLPNITSCNLGQFLIEQVYAGKEASISHIGFNYFKNCKNISEVEFVGCNTIDNKALSKLNILKDYLTNLKINGCINVSDQGIMSLEQLQALKYLELKNLQFLSEPEATIDHLKRKLPECNVQYYNE